MTDDYASSISTTGSVAVGGSATGAIEIRGDRDWFAVTLEAGKTYRFDLEGSPTSAGTLSDTYLYGLYDSAGNLISGTTNDDSGASYNSRVEFTATADATYYVSAGAYAYAYGSHTGTYTLSVGEVLADLTAGTGTAGTVAVGGSETGEIEFRGDRDWFAVTLEAGKTYRFDLEGLHTDAGTLVDPYLYGLYDAAGNPIRHTADDDSGVSWNSRVTFTATEDATYYVSAGGDRSLTGTYTLRVRDITTGIPDDDFTALTGTAGTVAVGGSATGEIEIGGDRDWFAVTLEAGKSYRIDLEGSPTSAGTLSDPYLRGLYNAVGHRIAGTMNNDGGAGNNSRVTFTATDDATYYVSAGADGSNVGTYRLSVEEVTDDFTVGTGTAGTVAVGGSETGEIERGGDLDWFAVTLEAGKIYRFDLEGSPTSAGTLSDPYLRGLYDAAGNRIAGTTNNDGGDGNNSRVTFTANEDATYYVSAGAHGSRTGTYTLSVEEVTNSIPDDLTAGIDTAGTVTVGGSATDEIELGGDRDWFAVTLEAGKIYRFDLEGSPTSAGTLSDTYLYGLYDSAGNLIRGTTNDDGGAGYNSRVTFTATADATYYVSAGAFGSRTGTYTLSVEEVTADLTAGTGTTGTVAVGGSATGEIERGYDRDWFAVTLEAGKIYRFDLEGSRTSAGTLLDPYLRGLYDSDGNPLSGTTDDNGGDGYNSRVAFTANEDATYYVSAGAQLSRTGTYTLSVRDITNGIPDDFTAGTDTAGTVAVGGSETGEIGFSGDHDWFAVTLEAGKIYRFDLEISATSDGPLHNPYLYGLYDAAGNLISGTTNDNGGLGTNSRVVFTATADATYYVSAGAYRSSTGAYTLSVREVPDDFTAGTGTAGAVTVDGSATGEIAFRGDRDWFAVTLEAGKTYRIDLEGWWTRDGTLSDAYLYGLYDAAGNLISGTTNDNGGTENNSRVVFTATADATYYVSAGAYGSSAYGSSTGTYRLSVRDITNSIRDDDYTAGTDTAGTVAVGGSERGEIERGGDRDWFAVTLEEGKTYQFDLEGSATRAGNLSDPYLGGLYDSDGNLISGTTDDDDGYGRNSRVVFTATADATYYVAADAYGTNVGTYTLSVEEIPDDFTARTNTAGTVAVGGSATGQIQFRGDRDWFAVTLEAGKTYRIDLEGSTTSAGNLSDPYLRGIYDAAGNVISGTTNDDSGAGYNSRFAFTAAANATYYVSAGAWGDREGTYRLSVRDITDSIPNDDFTAWTDTAGTVAVGGSATGAIERGGDLDWFAVTLEVDKTYQFDLEGSWTSAGTLFDPYLRGLHDAAGNLISGTADNNDGTALNSRVAFTATEDATYYVSAGAWGHGTGTYTLLVEEVL